VGPSLSWGYSFGKAWGVSFGRGDTPEEGGGGGSASKGKSASKSEHRRRKGWARERAIFEASREIRPIAKVVDAAKDAVIRPEVSYSAELERLDTLKQEFAKLQIAYNNKQEQDKDLQDASIALTEFLSDEEDTVGVLLATQEFEARQMLVVLGITEV